MKYSVYLFIFRHCEIDVNFVTFELINWSKVDTGPVHFFTVKNNERDNNNNNKNKLLDTNNKCQC